MKCEHSDYALRVTYHIYLDRRPSLAIIDFHRIGSRLVYVSGAILSSLFGTNRERMDEKMIDVRLRIAYK